MTDVEQAIVGQYKMNGESENMKVFLKDGVLVWQPDAHVLQVNLHHVCFKNCNTRLC